MAQRSALATGVGRLIFRERWETLLGGIEGPKNYYLKPVKRSLAELQGRCAETICLSGIRVNDFAFKCPAPAKFDLRAGSLSNSSIFPKSFSGDKGGFVHSE